MKDISLKECHDILLGIAKEFHRICEKYSIPYYMLGGTMLGAVRHSGFIPWDDDMDFGIPRVYYELFCEICSKELSYPYVFKNENNSEYAILGIGKIMNSRTIVKELYSINNKESLGLNIDIFPLDKTDSNVGLFSKNRYLRNVFKLQKILFINSTDRTFLKRVFAVLLQNIIKIDKRTIPNYIKKVYLKNTSNKDLMYFNTFGAWGLKELIPQNVFGSPTLYKFEDIELYGVKDYHTYLTSLYSNYMQLPPEEKRHIHFNKACYLE